MISFFSTYPAIYSSKILLSFALKFVRRARFTLCAFAVRDAYSVLLDTDQERANILTVSYVDFLNIDAVSAFITPKLTVSILHTIVVTKH